MKKMLLVVGLLAAAWFVISLWQAGIPGAVPAACAVEMSHKDKQDCMTRYGATAAQD